MQFLDGEVVHVSRADLVPDADQSGPTVLGGAEVVAHGEFAGLDPRASRGVPEGVFVGGVDGDGTAPFVTDAQVDQVRVAVAALSGDRACP